MFPRRARRSADHSRCQENSRKSSSYVSFLHPWMNEIVNQIVLMIMFFMLLITTLIVLRLQDTG